MKENREPFVKVPRRVCKGAAGSELKIYCYLAGLPSFYKTGAFPKRSEIARHTGLNHNTVDSALNGLLEKGFLERCKKVVSGTIPRTVYCPKIGMPTPQKLGQTEPQKLGQTEPQKLGCSIKSRVY